MSSYHPEHWQASWSIRTALIAIRSFFPTKAEGAVGGMDASDDDRKDMARASRGFRCVRCGQAHFDAVFEKEARSRTEGAVSSDEGVAAQPPALDGNDGANSQVDASAPPSGDAVAAAVEPRPAEDVAREREELAAHVKSLDAKARRLDIVLAALFGVNAVLMYYRLHSVF